MKTDLEAPISAGHGAAAALPTLVDILQQRAAQEPARVTYTFLHEGERPTVTLTCHQLDASARAIAAHLRRTLPAGARVLLLYPAGLEFISAFFGCLYAGVIAVPAPLLGTLTLKNSLARLQSIVDDAQASAVLTLTNIVSQIEGTAHELPALRTIPWLATDALSADEPGDTANIRVAPDALAYLQYTSGSTASPKGVMMTHANLAHQCDYIGRIGGYGQDSVVVSWLPHHHDFGLVNGLLQPLYSGGVCYLMSSTAFLKRPLRWLQAITRYGGTHSGAPNFAYELLTKKATEGPLPALDLKTWCFASCGAEPIRWETLTNFAGAFAPCGFDFDSFYSAYGMAEATLATTVRRTSDVPRYLAVDGEALSRGQVVVSQAADALKLVSCGRVSDDVCAEIVNPANATRCAADEVGEIWIAGGSVAAGYWQRPQETEVTFRAYLADTHEGPFLRGGDLGFVWEGEVYIAGRIKDIIIIRGQNYYPQDIEWTVQRSHPKLRTDGGAAIAVNVDGSEQLVVVQEVERGFDPATDQDEALDAIRRAIAEQHGVAVHGIQLVKRGMVPKTSSGKLQRQATRAAYLAAEFEAVADWKLDAEAEEAASAPADELEAQLVAIFRQVLKTPTVGVGDNFFARGGDSLGVVELNLLIEEQFGQTDAVSAQVDNLTVAALAASLRASLAPTVTPSSPASASPQPAAPPGLTPGQPLHKTASPLAWGTGQIRRSSQLLKRSLRRGGRRLAGATLPYSQGSAFLAWFCGQGWAQRAFYRRQVRLVQQTLAAMGQPASIAAIVRHSLICNTWSHWRLSTLLAAPASEFDRWVSVRGLEHLTQAHAAGRGVILLHSHSIYNALPMALLERQGITDMMLVGGKRRLLEVGLTSFADRLQLGGTLDRSSASADSGPGAGQSTRFARQLLDAQRILRQGGVFHVAADGYQTPRHIVAPFHGRQRSFGIGFAEMALNTGAAAIPVFVSLQPGGQVTIDFRPPLVAGAGARSAQVESLVRQYVGQFAAVWAADLGNIRWRHLAKYLRLPAWDPALEGIEV
ncbi:AMP-binding protein [Candidatus Amarolinea dominans]|uniref:LpxL/LpxP family acyltransferase n=1 Tax=Candidatus Amarolinea dominans TaxID=3140696 RepID=UPI0031362723|nr:AMP-binding protein [Anaerolineae bacterium]